MEFSNKTIINAMKSEKFGRRLNAIKHEVDAVTCEVRAVCAETEGLRDVGSRLVRFNRRMRVKHLEKHLKKLEQRGNKLEKEWNSLLLAFVNDTGKPSLQVVKG